MENNLHNMRVEGSKNTIYHNNFIRRPTGISRQVTVVEKTWDDGWYIYGGNTWDDGYPSGGNYWSDYTGVDLYSGPYQNEAGSDGIGDTPYVINGTNKDNYPLMSPWSPPPPPPPVGGNIVPINKLKLLMPYIGVASVILVTITIVVKKRKLL